MSAHACFLFPHLFWISALGMNWTTHDINCRRTQGARASEHLTLSKWDLWHCEDQVGCLAFILCHFCTLVLPFRQMDLSTALFRPDSNVYILQVGSHNLQSSSWGLRKATHATFINWGCGKISPALRVHVIHQHHRVSRGVHACLLWLGSVMILDISECCSVNFEGRRRELQDFWLRSPEGKLRDWDWCARTWWGFLDSMLTWRKR